MGSRVYKRFIFMMLDIGFTLVSWWLSAWMYSYFFKIDSTLLPFLVAGVPASVLLCIIIFSFSGVYKNLWLYPGMGDLIRISFASMGANFSIYVYYRIMSGFWQSPAIGMMAFYLVLTFSGGIRILPSALVYIQKYFNRKRKDPAAIRILVVGAGETAATLLDELQKYGDEESARMEAVAIVDDDNKKHGYILHGVPVLGNCNMIEEIVKRMDISEIIIATPSASNEQMRKIISNCPTNRCKVRVMPKIHNMGQSAVGELRSLNIEDLLGRAESILDTTNMEKLIGDSIVLVTGGGGSIGSELCRQILKFNPKQLIVFDIYENNIYNLEHELFIKYGEYAHKTLKMRVGSVQDIERLEEVFSECKPTVVFHAAAYKHVPLMEQSPELAIKNNVFGTYNTCKISKKFKVSKFVMISTDKAVNPTNVMGASKRISELIVQSFNSFGKTEYVCVRFGNVLGSNGSVIPVFQRQIEAGGPITVTHPEITRYFMTIPEAARLVIQAGAMANGGEIFILDMGQPIKIVDLATNMIRMSGLVPDIDIKIKFVGLRPGEKLYEELLLSGEDNIKTENDKIYIAKPSPVTVEKATDILEKLRGCLQSSGDIRMTIAEIVPEYTRTDNVELTHDSGGDRYVS